MKIALANLAKQVLRALAKAMPSLKTQVNKTKSFVFHGRKKKGEQNYGAITIRSPSVMDLQEKKIPSSEGSPLRIDGDHQSILSCVEETNKLADAFIDSFYQKMRLEKQQSYRMYQEMLARGT